MTTRTVTVKPYVLPDGATNTKVTVYFTLVDDNNSPMDGYIIANDFGIKGKYSLTVFDAEQSIDLVPNDEIYPTNYWQCRVAHGHKLLRITKVSLTAGAGLTLPDFLALAA